MWGFRVIVVNTYYSYSLNLFIYVFVVYHLWDERIAQVAYVIL